MVDATDLQQSRSVQSVGRSGRLALQRLRFLDPLALVGIALLVGAWYLVSPKLGPLRLPSPTATFSTMTHEFFSSRVISAGYGGNGGILAQLIPTIERTLEGVAIGGLFGVAAGVAMASVETLRIIVQPPLEALRLTPSLVAAPFLVLWFGVSPWAEIGLVAFYTFVTLQVYTFTAVRNLPPEYMNFAATLGASRWRIVRTVVLPAILPEMIGGLRAILQLAWGLEIVAELLGAQRGIGHMISSMLYLFRTDIIIAGILWVAIVAVITDWLVKLVTYRLTQWAPTLGAGAAEAL
jgi:ABC-type nitrate/sulfonate/bicarbonate transport system permease component